jgi:hypothetical protein
MIGFVVVVFGVGVYCLKRYINNKEFIPPLARRYAGYSLEAEIHNSQSLIKAYYNVYGVQVLLYDEVLILICRFVNASLLRFFRIIQKY